LNDNRTMSGTTSQRVAIQREDFDLSGEVARLREADAGVGAIATFVGTVRDRGAEGVPSTVRLELEHYPGMTERAIESMIDEALRRFKVRAARVIHRIGPLEPGDQIVLVAVTSAHRSDAFAACEFLMDYLKTQAPFWKKEWRPDGTSAWVDARVVDDAALARWGLASGNAKAA
jgi:molybdopterin synthase catalytic subunit